MPALKNFVASALQLIPAFLVITDIVEGFLLVEGLVNHGITIPAPP